METDWHERWALEQMGFQQQAIHGLLLSDWGQLAPHGGESVLVRQCGKTRDMGWLREHGHPVVGVELSPLAVEQFFAEASLEPARSQVGSAFAR